MRLFFVVRQVVAYDVRVVMWGSFPPALSARPVLFVGLAKSCGR